MKILLVGAELFRADRQADRHDEAKSCFSQICECAKHKKKNWEFFFIDWLLKKDYDR